MRKAGILFLVAMVVPLWFAATTAQAQYQVGDTVADFSLPDAYGNTVHLYDYKGAVIMLNFWAAW